MKSGKLYFWLMGLLLIIAFAGLTAFAQTRPAGPGPSHQKLNPPKFAQLRALHLEVERLRSDLKECEEKMEAIEADLEKCKNGESLAPEEKTEGDLPK